MRNLKTVQPERERFVIEGVAFEYDEAANVIQVVPDYRPPSKWELMVQSVEATAQ